ncbi:hypothetical protein ASG87_18315 [Frateuria sp. Soil773]|uniref:DUF58 domain-containing protein n=1 Tax=Frateuria sp. Soil773 TaxID=1736407 RepID=UPI0006F8B09E|nr:DUF58 domain-containing protein [Frateuria sp. Soil773]KRE93786.1 hypothetical protein ASG87_18315 [Frateuria sp. Soil773]
MRGAWRRLQQWGEQRLPALTRHRRPEALPIELHRRRIYIVPTGFGLGFGVLLLVMLLGALNYANNAALLLTCLLGAASVASMLVAFRALDGLRLTHIHAGHAVAGETLALILEFESQRPRSAIRIDLDATHKAFAIDDGGKARVEIPLPTAQRGWQALPRLRLWTHWPLGLFRAWSWLHPQQQVLVWPRPEFGGPPPRPPAEHARQRFRLHQGEDLATLRPYRAGDPRRHIAWKASARQQDLLTKDFEQPETLGEWRLDWRQLPGLGNEMRIARLARWLGEALAQGRPCSLWLPDQHIATGSGPLHYARCMDALAKLP